MCEGPERACVQTTAARWLHMSTKLRLVVMNFLHLRLGIVVITIGAYCSRTSRVGHGVRRDLLDDGHRLAVHAPLMGIVAASGSSRRCTAC